MIIRTLPLLIALIPFIGVSASYLIAIQHELLPTCIPYVDGCTSISATGRYEPASFLFRAVQMPLAALLFLLWPITVTWLHSLHRPNVIAERTILLAGSTGAFFLIVYVTFLGSQVEFYEFMRRFGIYGYFLGTSVAQLTLALRLLKLSKTGPCSLIRYHAWATFIFSLLPFALGILNLVLKAVLSDADRMENRIEWIAALSMQLFYFSLWLAWRSTDFQLKGESRFE